MILNKNVYLDCRSGEGLARFRIRIKVFESAYARKLCKRVLPTAFRWPSIQQTLQGRLGTANCFERSLTVRHENRRAPSKCLNSSVSTPHPAPPHTLLAAAILARFVRIVNLNQKFGVALRFKECSTPAPSQEARP